MKYSLWILLIGSLFSCFPDQVKNNLVQNVSNPKSDVKAVIFYTDGIVSVVKYHVAIVPHDHELTNQDTSNVFSYTWSDTIKVNKDTLLKVQWYSPTELVIKHPKTGTFWKKMTAVNYNGTNYKIRYEEQ